jgi:ankyrin repeat protein
MSEAVHWPVGSRILAKAVEPDLMPIRVLQNLLAERPDLAANRDFYPLPGLLKWPQASRDAILRGALADPKLVKLLLDHGADPNGAGGNEPIISTALLRTNGRPTVRAALLQLLLAHKPGIPLNVLSSFGAPPLLTALQDGCSGFQQLLEAGADPNVPDNHGNVPLSFTVTNNLVPETRALLSAGADPRRKNKNGNTPYDIASFLGRTEIVALFDSAGHGREEKKAR